MTLTVKASCKKQLDIEIKLHINQQLFEKGFITEEMYQKAKEVILRTAYRTDV